MIYPVLAIETTGTLASVALKDAEGNVYAEGLKEKLNHLKGLLPLTDKVLKEAGLDINDVKTIAVSQGPGSFTGIRIGISTVRALAAVTDAGIIGVPTLEAFVYNSPNYRGVVCPVFDARMNQMYAGAFFLEDGQIHTLIKTGAYSSPDYCGLLTEVAEIHNDRYETDTEFRFFGDGVDVFRPDIEKWAGRMEENRLLRFSCGYESENKLQLASSVLKWAEKFGEVIHYSELLPVYVRKAEAQRRLDEKNACTK